MTNAQGLVYCEDMYRLLPFISMVLTTSARFVDKKILFVLFLVFALLTPPLANLVLFQAHAGALSPAKLMINNSQAAASNVTYQFRFTTSVTTSIKQWTIQFCTTASGTCTTPTGFVSTGASIAVDNIAGTGRTNTFTSNGTLTTVVTTPSTQSTQAVLIDYTGITNPSTTDTTYYARITTYSDTGSTTIDTATVAFAILTSTSIAVTASVDPTLTFSIAGVTGNGTATVNGATITNGLATTASTIPFGTLSSGTAKIAAQDITVTTNASSGYTVTASHSANAQSGNPPLTSGSTNNIDAWSGTNGTPTTWSSPAGSTANTNTGYFGYTTEDSTLCTGTAARFTTTGPKWAGSTTSGAEIICNTGGVSSETTRIGWEVEVNNVQPPGSYSGTVILIATPTY